MAPPVVCHCCETRPQPQLTYVGLAPFYRDVVELMAEWRARPGNSKKPHTAMFPCGRGDVTRMGGAACRAPGGCAEKDDPCLVYRITAPFYHAMVPFLVADKNIFEKTVVIKDAVAKVKKSVKKTTAAAIEEREELERKLDSPFNVLRENFTDFIMACPVRYFNNIHFHIFVNNFTVICEVISNPQVQVACEEERRHRHAQRHL